MLINLLRDEQPTHIAAAFDVSRQTFRSGAIRSTRRSATNRPTSSAGRWISTKEVLGARIPVFAVDNYEADDVIATLTTQAREQGFASLVVTGDRDALQLVDDGTTVLYPKRGVSELTRFTLKGGGQGTG